MHFTVDIVSQALGWCVAINYALLAIWFLALVFFREGIFRLHSRWFNLVDAEFDAMHYAAMMRFKILVFIFYLTPYLALRLID